MRPVPGVEPRSQNLLEIGLVLYPQVTLLDVAGPSEVFARTPDARVSLIAAEYGPLLTDTGLQLVANRRFDDAPSPDLLFVPGGPGQVGAAEDVHFLSFLRRSGKHARFISSVCTGSLLLGAAGLLDGYRATSHWLSLDLLRYFGAHPVPARVVKDGNRVTGAGVSAGIDVALKLVSLMRGEGAAKEIQLLIEYDPEPPFACGSPRTAPRELVERVEREREDLQRRRREQAKRLSDTPRDVSRERAKATTQKGA